jgi:hypothetical protein
MAFDASPGCGQEAVGWWRCRTAHGRGPLCHPSPVGRGCGFGVRRRDGTPIWRRTAAPRGEEASNVWAALGRVACDGMVDDRSAPDHTPIRVTVSSPNVEVCPVTVDGATLNDGWPSATGFVTCMSSGPHGSFTLPVTDGNWHVAFAIRTTTKAAVANVTVDYQAAETFMMVIPPANSDATITFTPHSSTVGAHAYQVPTSPSRPGSLSPSRNRTER